MSETATTTTGTIIIVTEHGVEHLSNTPEIRARIAAEETAQGFAPLSED